MSPPGNENATRQGGALLTDDKGKVIPSATEGKLWPANVELLRSRGVAFTWQQAEHDLRMSCPHCAGILTIHEEKPWHYCNGIACGAHLFTFAEIVAVLPVDQSEVQT
jgi:hypothetical protein